MVYGIVALILLCQTAKGCFGKKTSSHVQDVGDSFVFNLLRMVFCILIGLALVALEGAVGALRLEWGMLLICLLSGAANAAFLVGWILAVQKNTMVAVDVCLTLGSIIPAVLCAILFGEAISIPKMLGFALILGATAVLSGGGAKRTGGGAIGILLLIFASAGEGLSGFAQQLFKQYYTDAGTRTHGVLYPKTVFHFYTYVFAALILLTVLVVYRLRTRTRGGETEKRRLSVPPTVALYIFIMAVCLFAANYLQTVATNDFGMSSQILYPILKGGCLITVNFTAMIFFGEKITRRSILGSCIALCGIVCMNLL
ncbi:MAG: hypothetical protein IJW29_00100 [Clostridia bacterium]|nr:hypothetical protein [Clostridia bacterium]